MKKLIFCVLSILIFGLSKCCMSYSIEESNGITYGVSDTDCFIGEVIIDYDNSGIINYTVPDEYNGLKVTKLGGYFGRGVPTPFYIILKTEDGKYCYSSDYVDEDDEYEVVKVNIYIGDNIDEFQNVYFDPFIGVHDSETDTYDCLYEFDYYFIISENNKYFYSKDGNVYSKKTDELIEY